MTRSLPPPPVRVKLFRLNRADTEWIENAIQEDVKRGQLEKGNSEWGFPAFPTKVAPSYKAIQRGRRMVVDYRELNKVTQRKFFLIPNSDYIKSTVAGNEFISVGDLATVDWKTVHLVGWSDGGSRFEEGCSSSA